MWPVALGIAAATATILGALLVGDSLRGSLRFLAMDRIGQIDQLVMSPNFFSEDVAAQLKPQSIDPSFGQSIPLILFPNTSLELRSGQDIRRSSGILTLGIKDDFWNLGTGITAPPLRENEIILNQALADQLQAEVNQTLVLQVPAPMAVPADNPLGKRDSESVAIADLKVVAILPNKSLARLDLQSNQRSSLNAFVSIKTVQSALSRPNQINAIALSRSSTTSAYDADVTVAMKLGDAVLQSAKLSLSDLGFHLERHTATDPANEQQKIFDYYQITSDRMLIPDSAVDALNRKFTTEQSTHLLTYLANGIQSLAASDRPVVPYSTITGIDPAIVGPDRPIWQLPTSQPVTDHPLQDGECLINQWLADNGKIAVGDEVQIDYYLSENQDGREVEKSFKLKVAGIVPITEPSQPYRRNRPAVFEKAPTVFNDPAMTPTVAGITDQDSISQWQTPFPLTRTVSQDDDDYWKDYRLTPKLYLTLNKSQQLFGSRFGSVSGIRLSTEVAPDATTLETQVASALQSVAPELMWRVLPLRAQQLQASQGSTPFDGLFLALSFFVIVAALMLIFLLVRLAVEARANHWGILKAGGWSPSRVNRLILSEFMPIIAAGVLIGVPLGFAFCVSVLELLKGQWVGAIGVPFLDFHWTLRSVAIGMAIGGFSALLTIWVSIFHLSKSSVVQLLRGNLSTDVVVSGKGNAWISASIMYACLLLTIGLPFVAIPLQGPAKAGAYLGAGFCALIGLLIAYDRRYVKLSAVSHAQSQNAQTLSLGSMAASSLRRNRLRSILAVSLIAVASFLLLSVSLFHVEPDAKGTGGFTLMAKSDLPIVRDLNDSTVREDALGDADAAKLTDDRIVPMRLRGGDDAGCNNLYQANQPQVLGVNPIIESIDRADKASSPSASQFAWAGQAPVGSDRSIWSLLALTADGTAESPIPVIIDQNTAMWGLHLKSSIGELFHYQYDGRDIYFRTVGLLQNTIMQGYLIIGESNFKKVFPEIVGNRFFLIATAQDQAQTASSLFERGWASEGLDVVQSHDVLAQLLAVQNTYLSAFQSLGTLGLILGSLGLAVIQIRSVVERRSELGVLRAVGYNSWRIASLLLVEHLTLLISGAIIGLLSALLAVAFAAINSQAIGGISWPILMMGFVLLVGIVAGLLAVRRAVHVPVLDALRSQ
jgi:ABC-type antimicrobial peptide transport system permease subunit